MLISALLILSFNLITSALQHEKSFMFDSTASSVFAIAVYKRSLLITSSNDVIQKDIETGIFQRKFVAHSSIIESILVVNGTTMITTGGDDMVIVWDLISGSIMRRIWLEAPRTFPSSMAIKNSDLFVSGRDGKVRIVNLLSGRVATRIDLEVSVVAIRVKDNHFYVGKQDSTSQLEKYSIPARSLLLSYEGHQSSVFTLFLHGAFLFSGSFDSTIICWNEENGQIIRIYSGHSTAVWVIAIIDDYLYSASEPEGIFKWNIDSGAIENIFPVSHLNTIYCFAFENGTLYSGSTDTTVIRWDLRTSSKLFTYGGRKTRLRALVLWKNVVLAAGDGPVLTIQDKSQNTLFPVEIISGHESGVLCMIMINDTFFTGGVDATIRRRSFIDFSDIKIYNGHSLAVSSLVLDEDYMYSGSYDFTLKQWNIASGSIENDYIGHERDIWSIQVQGQFLYSGSLDSSVMIWDKESAAMVKAIGYSTEVYLIYIYDEALIVVHESLDMVSLSAGETIARQEESFSCTSMIASMYRIFSGHDDGVIRARDPLNLNILECFQGHNDNVMSVWFDEAGVLFSAGFDGSVKKWDMASRKVSFSYENRNGSVTALATVNGILSVGTREGTMHLFDTRTAFITNSSEWHQGAVTALAHVDGIMYSSGIDGKVLEFYQTDSLSSVLLYDSMSLPITTMALNTVYVIALQDVIEIVLLPRRNSSGSIRIIISPSLLVSIAANEDMIFGGSRAGPIIVWSILTLQNLFTLEDHTSQVNFLLVAGSFLFSASNDKTIIKWSLDQRIPSVRFKRLSSTALGHLGPVNSISICRGTLFSAGADLTTRRWNTQTGRHEDVYFGPTKAVTSVLCYNESVFAGSEDFSVLMYSPVLPLTIETQMSVATSTNIRRGLRTKISLRFKNSNSALPETSVLIGGIIAAVILVATVPIAYFYCSSRHEAKPIRADLFTSQEASGITTNLDTVVNTVIGISKHAAYLVESSNLATIKKLASGGGGEVFLARVMNSFLKEKTGTLVIQKAVFIKNSKSEEAFYQEVGIMIMLSPFPNFCRIIGYTENPVSMILKYYPDGSLQDWIHGKNFGRNIIVKLSKEISSALKIMHNYHLAHCDLKPQNVLVEVVYGIPTCSLTDFGITQVLSETILASRAFNVINLRGLSVYYASPEAFTWFRTKVYTGVDFKKFDVYSLACIIQELLTRKTPWS